MIGWANMNTRLGDYGAARCSAGCSPAAAAAACRSPGLPRLAAAGAAAAVAAAPHADGHLVAWPLPCPALPRCQAPPSTTPARSPAWSCSTAAASPTARTLSAVVRTVLMVVLALCCCAAAAGGAVATQHGHFSINGGGGAQSPARHAPAPGRVEGAGPGCGAMAWLRCRRGALLAAPAASAMATGGGLPLPAAGAARRAAAQCDEPCRASCVVLDAQARS